MQTNKWLRMQFYKNAVIENYSNVVFSGNVASNIRKNQNHLDFKQVAGNKVRGNINWYWGKEKERYNGNVCVAIYSSNQPNTSSWALQPNSPFQEDGWYRIIFNNSFDETEEGTIAAARWTKEVFDTIARELKAAL